MALVKCPRCELNYMQDTERVCAVCKRELRGEDFLGETDICVECGERPAEPGEELCAVCLKELASSMDHTIDDGGDETVMTDESALVDMDTPGDIEEIQIEPDDDLTMDAEYSEIAREMMNENVDEDGNEDEDASEEDGDADDGDDSDDDDDEDEQ